MVEEDEGSDHLPLAMRRRAAYREAVAEIARARHDHEIERIAGHGIAEHGIVRGLPTHGGLLLTFLNAIVAEFPVGVATKLDHIPRCHAPRKPCADSWGGDRP